MYRYFKCMFIQKVGVFLLNTAASKDLPFVYVYIGTFLPGSEDLLYEVLFCFGWGFFCMKYVCLAYECYILQPA